MQHPEVQDFPYGILDILYPGITEFVHLVTIHADQVIMLLVSVAFFKLGKIFSKLMLRDEITFYQ